MNDPERLSDGNDAAAELLRAMRDERPPAGAAQRALVALGVGSAALVAGGSAAAGSAGLGTSSWLAILKWIGGGAAVGVVVAGGAGLLEHQARDATPRASVIAPAAPPAAESTAANEARPAPPAPPAPAAVESERTGETPELAPTRPKLAAGSASAPQDTLAREVELLDRARGALRAGDAAAALSTLDRLTREHPRARLGAEALVVRLQALMQAGRTAEARTLAESQLRAHPESPHAARMRAIVGLTETD